MAATKVTQAMLTDAATSAESAGQSIASQLSSLLSTVETEGAASFKGTGGTSLQNVSQQLSQELQTLLGALNTMAENVNASNRAFGTSDEDIAHDITSVAGQAPQGGSVISALRG